MITDTKPHLLVAPTWVALATLPGSAGHFRFTEKGIEAGKEEVGSKRKKMPPSSSAEASWVWQALRERFSRGSLQGVQTASQDSPPFLDAKGSFLIRTSITLSICSKRIQLLLRDGEVH